MQKCTQLELDLRTSDETLLSMLEYGADPKEMDHPGAASLVSNPHIECSILLGGAYIAQRAVEQPIRSSFHLFDSERAIHTVLQLRLVCG